MANVSSPRAHSGTARLSGIHCAAHLAWLGGVLLLAAACGTDAKPTDNDAGGGGPDGFIFGSPDATPGADTTSDATGTDVATDPDSAPKSDVGGRKGQLVGVEIQAAKTSLMLAERADLIITVVRSDGSKAPATAKDAPIVAIDGVVQTGAGVAPPGKTQPAVAAWSFGGKRQIVGVRPGKASIVVTIAGKASAPLAVTVAYPTTPGVRCAVADAAGSTAAARKMDLPDTVQLHGKQAAAGGLTATLRFPMAAQPGDRLDLSKPPAKGGLTISLAFADLAGAAAKPVEGAMWIDQTAKGLFRGTFLGRTTQLKPAVGVFIVERQGMFGIDLLDDPVALVKSDNLQPTTGEHYSRVSLAAVGDGKAVLYARHISDGLQARLERWQIDGKTGEIKLIAPLVAKANAYVGTPNIKAEAFGSVIRASHPTVTAELWEGRIGLGANTPHRLNIQLLDASGAVIGKVTPVSDDKCDGACQPVVVRLPSTRFLVLWTAPGGGVKVRRIKGQPVSGAVDFVEATPLVLSKKGTDGVVAVHDNNVLAGWFDPDKGHVWRLYTNKSSGGLSALAPAQAVGITSTKAPRQGLLAVKTPTGAPNLLFVTTWIDFTPTGKLAMRRIGIDGTAFGLPSPIADVDADALWARTGKDGQIALLHRTKQGGLVVRKLRFGSFQDPGTALGDPVTMLAGAAYAVLPALVYLSDADVWVLAWSGNQFSPGIHVRRFR